MKAADTLLRLPSAQQRGFGVVEIMVAVAISLFLLAGLYTVFLNAKSSYDTQQGLSLLQENARYAMSRLTKVIRMAGFNGEGCSRVLNLGGPNTGTPYVEGFNTSPNGTSWAPALPARLSPSQLTHTPAPGSDVIEVNTVYGPVTTLTSPITTNNSLYHFAVDNKYNLQSGDRVQLSNCFNATPITISRIDGKNIYFRANPSLPAYDAGTTLQKMRSQYYFIANDTDGKNCLQGGCGLWLLTENSSIPGNSSSSREEELVNGVDNMQIEYGLDNSGVAYGDASAQQVEPASSRLNWNSVVSVDVSMLFNSIQPVTLSQQPQTFYLLDQKLTIDNRLLHRMFSSYIALRNRLN